MATLTIQDVVIAGITPSYAAATVSGDQFQNNGRCIVQAKNVNGATRTITIASQITIAGLAVDNPTVVLPITTGDKMFGPFPQDIYNDANGYVQLTYSAVTDVTIGVFRW